MQIKSIFFFIIIIWLTFLSVSYFYTPLTIPVTHTYGLPSAACINQLTSDRWSFEAIRIALWLPLFSMVPWTIVLMLWTRERVGWLTHFLYILIMITFGILTFAYDISDMSTANLAPSDPAFKRINFARDPKWCNLYGGIAGTSTICCNSSPCVGPGLLVENLIVNWPYILRFAINVFLTLLMGMDGWYSFMLPYGIPASASKTNKKK
jgi:hypothetical protein